LTESAASSSESSSRQLKLLRKAVLYPPSELEKVKPCEEYGIGDGKKLWRGKCSCFSADALAERVTWLRRQETVEGKGLDQVRMRLRSYRGTMGKLLSWVEENYKEVLLHKWRLKYLRHQFHLEAEYFEPTTAVVLADFATAIVGRMPMLLHESRIICCTFLGSWLRVQRNM